MPPLLFFFGTTEAEQALLSFLFELLRPLGGPSVTTLASGLAPVFAFVAAMFAGMALYKWIS